jgi:3-methyladenine DNA glycosylase/8-oxoguanine DNA glycosylase
MEDQKLKEALKEVKIKTMKVEYKIKYIKMFALSELNQVDLSELKELHNNCEDEILSLLVDLQGKPLFKKKTFPIDIAH